MASDRSLTPPNVSSLVMGVLLLLIVASASSQPITDNSPDEMQQFPDPIKLMLVQRLLDARLADGGRPVRKRTCLINGGLSHGCDYKDLMGAMEESHYWNSALSPGRRRRSANIPQDVKQELLGSEAAVAAVPGPLE